MEILGGGPTCHLGTKGKEGEASESTDISSVKRHAQIGLRVCLRVVVLIRRAGVQNPIPSSYFSKSVAEISKHFSKVLGHHFRPALKLPKDIVCVLKFELVYSCCNRAQGRDFRNIMTRGGGGGGPKLRKFS